MRPPGSPGSATAGPDKCEREITIAGTTLAPICSSAPGRDPPDDRRAAMLREGTPPGPGRAAMVDSYLNAAMTLAMRSSGAGSVKSARRIMTSVTPASASCLNRPMWSVVVPAWTEAA